VLHGLTHPSDGPDHQVGLQAVTGLNGPVAEVLNSHLVSSLVLQGHLVDVLAGRSESGHRLVENEGLLGIDFQIATDGADQLRHT